VDLLQDLNFGRIEGLHVRGGEPTFEPAPRIVQKLKMGGENGPRPESTLDDFWLKHQVVEMFDVIAGIGEGQVLAIDVKNGLPFSLEVVHPSRSTGSRNYA